MKHFIVVVSASLLALPLFGQEKSPQLKDQKDKVSYSIGMNIGFNLSKQKVDINPDILAAGIKDSIAGKPLLTQDQVKDVMAQFEKDMEQKQKQAGEKNKADGAKFLEENKKKPGVKTTASGLQYKAEKEGTGAQPKATDMVTVNYRGHLSGERRYQGMDRSASTDESRIKVSVMDSIEPRIWRTLRQPRARSQRDSHF